MRMPSQRVRAMAYGVEVGEPLLLHAVDGQLLAEVAVAVEEPDADEGDAEVARRLQVVAGQHAEAAGVLRQRLGDAELRREVGDQPQRAGLPGLGPGLEPAGRGEVAVELVLGLLEVAEEARVGGQLRRGGGGGPGRAAGPGRGTWPPTRPGRPSGTGRGWARPTTSAGSWPAARAATARGAARGAR